MEQGPCAHYRVLSSRVPNFCSVHYTRQDIEAKELAANDALRLAKLRNSCVVAVSTERDIAANDGGPLGWGDLRFGDGAADVERVMGAPAWRDPKASPGSTINQYKRCHSPYYVTLTSYEGKGVAAVTLGDVADCDSLLQDMRKQYGEPVVAEEGWLDWFSGSLRVSFKRSETDSLCEVQYRDLGRTPNWVKLRTAAKP